MAKKRPFEDDGRTIAEMHVEGMPWYKPGRGENPNAGDPDKQEALSREDRRAYVWGAIKASLLVFAVFALVFLLFLLFADNIWLR